VTRIVAGAARGRRLVVPPGDATRPTSDRAREALFSALEARLAGLAGRPFLDLYAGSGAVGLEALSRGAGRVVLVEHHRAALAAIRANVAAVGLPGVQVSAERVERFVASPNPGAPFDVVFLDPPYSTPAAQVSAVLVDLLAHGWLRPEGLVVVERATRDGAPDWPAGLVGDRGRQYGEASLWYGHAGGCLRRGVSVRRVVCPGSFDPVTNGHLDIVGRAADLWDEVTVAVLVNRNKSGLFSVAERMEMLATVTQSWPNVRIDSFDGLLVDFCRDRGIPAIVKGLRAVSDFDYELQMAQMNHRLAGVETLFVPTNAIYSYLSSSLVKEVALHGGDISGLVPDLVADRLRERVTAR
jgi:pantetheine-phosphate adenylyltransferase/16S rRNA (guanine(966)-N(2))-methyltransferase RsmD